MVWAIGVNRISRAAGFMGFLANQRPLSFPSFLSLTDKTRKAIRYPHTRPSGQEALR